MAVKITRGNQNNSYNNNKLGEWILICGLVVIVCLLMLYILLQPTSSTLLHIKASQDYIQKNDLKIPLPNIKELVALDGTQTNIDYAEENFVKYPDPEEFNEEIIKPNFEYNQDYDCKYWVYVWSVWWDYTKNQHDMEFRTVALDNHIYAVVYDESEYCVLDQNSVECQELS